MSIFVTDEEYINKRVKEQIKWYDKKSFLNKKINFIILFFIYLLSSSLPIIALISFNFKEIIIAILGSIIALLNLLKGLIKPDRKWIEYRTNSELLKYNLNLYITKSDPYKGTDSFNSFVMNVENIIIKENENWISYSFFNKTNENENL